MKEKVRFLGLNVHAGMIAIAGQRPAAGCRRGHWDTWPRGEGFTSRRLRSGQPCSFLARSRSHVRAGQAAGVDYRRSGHASAISPSSPFKPPPEGLSEPASPTGIREFWSRLPVYWFQQTRTGSYRLRQPSGNPTRGSLRTLTTARECNPMEVTSHSASAEAIFYAR
jgi:hypothetical protein